MPKRTFQLLGAVALMIGLSGCGGKKSPAAAVPNRASSTKTPSGGKTSAGVRALAHAKAMALTGNLPANARRDCSGFIEAAYRAGGDTLAVPVAYRKGTQVSAMLHAWSTAEQRAYVKGEPAPGDLVFFRDTIGALDHRVTHVGMVERIEIDGTVTVLHYLSGRIRRDSMDLGNPDDPTRNGWLRKRKRASEPALAGELFVAYARF